MLNEKELLKLATEMEGHPDNVAPALLGGLVVSIIAGEEIITRRYEVPEFTVVIVKPNMEWPTKIARAVLPKSVSRADSIYNIGRAALVIDALCNGDLDLLQKVMDDRIHQPYRNTAVLSPRSPCNSRSRHLLCILRIKSKNVTRTELLKSSQHVTRGARSFGHGMLWSGSKPNCLAELKVVRDTSQLAGRPILQDHLLAMQLGQLRLEMDDLCIGSILGK